MIRQENSTPPDEENVEQTDDATAETAPGQDIERFRAEAAEWQDKYLRKLAEFDNYRKRTRQESEMLGQFIAESIMATLLPIMDDFDRVIAGISDAESPYRKGVEMIRDKLRAFFDARGVSKCECVGQPFDPEQHDALLTRSTRDFPPHTVLEVIRPGYRMGDRVIRHAQVIVSADMAEETNSADANGEGEIS